MISNSNLLRWLSAIEGKTTDKPQPICLFVMPGESEDAAVTRRFGLAGPPPGAKVLAFTWQPTQDEPGHGGGL